MKAERPMQLKKNHARAWERASEFTYKRGSCMGIGAFPASAVYIRVVRHGDSANAKEQWDSQLELPQVRVGHALWRRPEICTFRVQC